jgi:hypothetical protein
MEVTADDSETMLADLSSGSQYYLTPAGGLLYRLTVLP